MSRHFTEDEKQMIRLRLLNGGKKLFEEYGVKKTSVDRIVEKVGIAKGSFYNFYPSKEAMVFDIIMDMEMELHKEEMGNLHTFLTEYEFPDAMRYTVLKSLDFMESKPLLLMVNDPPLVNEIWSKISEQDKERSVRQDQSRIADFIQEAEQKGYKLTTAESVFKASLMSFFSIYINQGMVGESAAEALELIMKATLDKLFISDRIGGEV